MLEELNKDLKEDLHEKEEIKYPKEQTKNYRQHLKS